MFEFRISIQNRKKVDILSGRTQTNQWWPYSLFHALDFSYVAQVSPALILFPQPPECWHRRWVTGPGFLWKSCLGICEPSLVSRSDVCRHALDLVVSLEPGGAFLRTLVLPVFPLEPRSSSNCRLCSYWIAEAFQMMTSGFLVLPELCLFEGHISPEKRLV